ncbi:MAG: TetR/AcrR family transcriptional regulator [Vicinamibacteria bacterium]
MFSSKGYDATSVREICEASGITKPTLYHFYGSKEGVYRALVEGALEDFEASVSRAIEASSSTREAFQRVARVYFEKARGRRELMSFIVRLIHGPPGVAPTTDFPRYYQGVVSLVAEVVKDGVRKGELAPGPTEVRVLVFMGALGEAFCGFLLCGSPVLTPELADSIVDTLFTSWR